MTAKRDDIVSFARRKSGGRYVRLMGTLHRHTKPEKAGDAALGMWTRILSYVADTGRAVLTKREMQRIMAGDKNGPRKLKALLDEKLLDKVGDDFIPHDFYDHNPGLDTSEASSGTQSDGDGESNASGTRVDGEENETGNATSNVTGIVSKPPEQNQQLAPPLSDPRPKTQETLRESQEKHLPDADAPVIPLPAERIRELSARYRDAGLLTDVRHGCALSRKNARMADSVWANVLESCAKHDVRVVERAMRTFSERHADGSKDERYLLAIVRGESDRANRPAITNRPQRAAPTHAADFADEPSEEEQLARFRQEIANG